MVKWLFIPALLLTWNSLVSAETSDETFARLASEPIHQCTQKYGLTSIGGVDFSLLLQEIKTVKWAAAPLRFSGSGGLRPSGMNLQKTRTVYINSLSPRQAAYKFIQVWLLHEAFGTLGFDDETYEKSVAIGFCAYTDSKIHLQQLLKMETPFTRRSGERTYQLDPNQYAGGATVVGSGGDLDVINMKLQMLLHFPSWHQQKKLKDTGRMYEAMRKLLVLRMERSQNVSYTFMWGDPIDDFFSQHEKGYVQMNRIWDGETIVQERMKVIDQISRFVY